MYMVNYYKVKKYFNSFHLQVDEENSIYVREYGKKNGIPLFLLHGGPGGPFTNNKITKLINLNKFHLILIDQRGCGKSTPSNIIKNNNTRNIIKDIRKVKEYLEIKKFIISGFSWGAYLAFMYILKYPKDILSYIIVSGIYLFDKNIFPKVVFQMHPERWSQFCELINFPKKQIQNPSLKVQKDICKKYFNKIKNSRINNKYSKEWFYFEHDLLNICEKKKEKRKKKYSNKEIYQISLLESYFYYKNFFGNQKYIMKNLDKIKNIKGTIIHGRIDVICNVHESIELNKLLPNSKLIIVDNNGHNGKDINKEFIKELRKFY